MNRRVPARILYLVLAALASYYFTSLWFELTYEFSGAPWIRLINGTAPTAFQYRVLIPYIMQMLLKAFISGYGIFPFRSILFWSEFVLLFLLVLSFRSYLRLFLEERTAAVFSMTLFLILPYNLILDRVLALRYPSDVAAILFFTIGLLLLHNRNWLLFYPLFVLATFNRETSCFLTVVYISVAAGCDRSIRIVLHACAQLIIWCAIKYWLYLVYLPNPGGALFVWNVRANIDFFTRWQAYPLILSNLGYLWLPVLAYWKRIPDPFVRRTVAVVPVFFGGMFLVGNLWELRIFAELIPVVLSAFVLMLKEGQLEPPRR